MEEGDGRAKVNDQDKQKVPFYKLFLFSDQYDISLMIIGSFCAIGNGLSQPLMTLIFGDLINTFGATDSAHIVPMVSKVPNGIGTILAIVQLALYFYYSSVSRGDLREPLLVTYV